LRDWVGYLGDKQVKTPNLDRLAARGMVFTRSYCAAPVCNPSRTALLTGLRPGTTAVYDNKDDWRKLVPMDLPRLTQHFRANGYFVAGAGKIWHGGFPPPKGDWDDYAKKGNDSKDIKDSKDGAVFVEERGADETWGFGNFQIGPNNKTDEQMPDFASVE